MLRKIFLTILFALSLGAGALIIFPNALPLAHTLVVSANYVENPPTDLDDPVWRQADGWPPCSTLPRVTTTSSWTRWWVSVITRWRSAEDNLPKVATSWLKAVMRPVKFLRGSRVLTLKTK